MQEEYMSKNFDHLGIVSIICDEIGIQEKVDNLIPHNPLVKLTLGECIKLLYTSDTLQEISPQIKWISRVPEKLLAAKELINSMVDLQEVEPGYCAKEVSSIYGGVQQRWLLVHSQHAYAREEKALKKQVQKEFERAQIDLNKLSHQDFDCEHDARDQLKRWAQTLKYHQVLVGKMIVRSVKQGRGRPRLNESLDQKYRIQGELQEDAERIDQELRRKGRFIVATNELDPTKLSAREMLFNYKLTLRKKASTERKNEWQDTKITTKPNSLRVG
jgi:transposase